MTLPPPFLVRSGEEYDKIRKEMKKATAKFEKERLERERLEKEKLDKENKKIIRYIDKGEVIEMVFDKDDFIEEEDKEEEDWEQINRYESKLQAKIYKDAYNYSEFKESIEWDRMIINNRIKEENERVTIQKELKELGYTDNVKISNFSIYIQKYANNIKRNIINVFNEYKEELKNIDNIDRILNELEIKIYEHERDIINSILTNLYNKRSNYITKH